MRLVALVTLTLLVLMSLAEAVGCNPVFPS